MKMPENMKLASIWVVWAFIAIGVLGWTLMLVVTVVGIEDAPSWVQAFGSIAAIGIAIWVSWYSQKKMQEVRHSEAIQRDIAHAVRLHTVMWEAATALAGLIVQAELNEAARKAMTELNVRLGPSYGGIVPDKIRVRPSDVGFFSRVLQRAMANLDDDLSPHRQAIAARFRYNLSILVNDLESRVDECDGRLNEKLKKAHDCFKADLVKLDQQCPFLSEFKKG